jgi:hypothetical protein
MLLDSMFPDHDMLYTLYTLATLNQSVHSTNALPKDLIICTEQSAIHNFSILNLHGITASKSSGYRSLRDFANSLRAYKERYLTLKFETDDDFDKNTSFIKSRWGEDKIFDLYHFEWNNKYFLVQEDGSHHLAAIYRQCLEQDKDYKLRCRVIQYKLNSVAVNKLTDDYDLFIVHGDNYITLAEKFNSLDIAYFDYGFVNNRCYGRLFLIRKQNLRSRILCSELKKKSEIINLGQYISRLCQ